MSRSRHVGAIAGRLSLRPPQRESLKILDHVTELVSPQKNVNLAMALEAIRDEYPSVTDFERDFPSLCFALATGVGKTRLMGAFIAYLHLEHKLNNFFVLAPNLTIYNKLIADFTPNTPKYVFKGISEFATEMPRVVTGDNYDMGSGTLFDPLYRCNINIFNISKINSEMRGGKAPRVKRLQEYIGESYFDYLANLPDLVLLMDESHRYRASAGVRALNELNPVLGLELTATPWVETPRGPVGFRNVIYDYPLSKAMQDGFVKEPAVVTRENIVLSNLSAEDIESIKLEDGMRMHETVKVELETYALQTGKPRVKPFLLIIARDTTHAGTLMNYINSEDFLGGRYAGRVIQVDSSKTGAEEEMMVERLLRVEHSDEPTEIVIHVNMLKEGWDVTNLYTIVPLRAANARILVEQSIGRGLRLPYGTRTGVEAVDRLSIIAHDRFQEIIDEARRPGSIIRLQTIVLADPIGQSTPTAVISPPNIEVALQIGDSITYNNGTGDEALIDNSTSDFLPTFVPQVTENPFKTLQAQEIARTAYRTITRLASQPHLVPSTASLARPEVQARLVAEVERQINPAQLEIEGMDEKLNVAAIVAQTSQLVTANTIDIPRILVVPEKEVRVAFKSFVPQLDSLRLITPPDHLYLQYLRTGQEERISSAPSADERRLEDYVVAGLVNYDDVAYDEHADLLYDLATQTVEHFLNDRSRDDVRKTFKVYQKEIARHLHAQMQEHAYEEPVKYEVVISKGFTPLKSGAYTTTTTEPLNYRQSPVDKNNFPRYVFGDFSKCLYPYQKFDSDSERRLAIILERDAQKWFRPARGQFQIFYRLGHQQHEYQPDFVAETSEAIYLLEPKSKKELDDPEVMAKRDAAVAWCRNATNHAKTYGGKPWHYLLIPHDAVAENLTLTGLASGFAVKSPA